MISAGAIFRHIAGIIVHGNCRIRLFDAQRDAAGVRQRAVNIGEGRRETYHVPTIVLPYACEGCLCDLRRRQFDDADVSPRPIAIHQSV